MAEPMVFNAIYEKAYGEGLIYVEKILFYYCTYWSLSLKTDVLCPEHSKLINIYNIRDKKRL